MLLPTINEGDGNKKTIHKVATFTYAIFLFTYSKRVQLFFAPLDDCFVSWIENNTDFIRRKIPEANDSVGDCTAR